MQPHANLGIRVRRYHILGHFAGQSGAKNIDKKAIDLMSIFSMLAHHRLNANTTPFWKRFYRQGKRG